MQSLDLSLTVNRPINQAQDQVLGHVDPLLRTRYTARRSGNIVEYRPKFVGLPMLWAVRRLQGDRITFTFEPRDPATEVRVTGRVYSRRRTELTDLLRRGTN